MGMTKEERIAKNEIMKILGQEGYPTYASLLNDFDVNLTLDPSVVGYMEPSRGRIVVNRGLDLEQVSVVIRHEILHEYLSHERRLLKKLADDRELKFDELDDLSIKELKNELYSTMDFNIAADYEISNRGYTDKDKQNIRALKLNGQILTGLVTEDEHPDWINLSVEDMYDKLQKAREEDKKKKSEEQVIFGKLLPDGSFLDIGGTVYGI